MFLFPWSLYVVTPQRGISDAKPIIAMSVTEGMCGTPKRNLSTNTTCLNGVHSQQPLPLVWSRVRSHSALYWISDEDISLSLPPPPLSHCLCHHPLPLPLCCSAAEYILWLDALKWRLEGGTGKMLFLRAAAVGQLIFQCPLSTAWLTTHSTHWLINGLTARSLFIIEHKWS